MGIVRLEKDDEYVLVDRVEQADLYTQLSADGWAPAGQKPPKPKAEKAEKAEKSADPKPKA